MGKRPDPLFLEPGSYRQRRLLDAVRMLVFLGIALWMIPVMWPDAGGAEGVPVSHALFYVFGVWAMLIALSAFLASRPSLLSDEKPSEGREPKP